MLQHRAIADEYKTNSIKRTLFTDNEEAFAPQLLGLAIIDEVIDHSATLNDLFALIDVFRLRVQNQISVIDVTAENPLDSQMLWAGHYKLSEGLKQPYPFIALPNVLQRQQVLDDYFTCKTLGQPLYCKVTADLNGQRWLFDRILVPIQNQNLNIIVSAFWHIMQPMPLARRNDAVILPWKTKD